MRIFQMSVGRSLAALAVLAVCAAVALIVSGPSTGTFEMLTAKKSIGLKGDDMKLLKVRARFLFPAFCWSRSRKFGTGGRGMVWV
jgi:hypothetical protein